MIAEFHSESLGVRSASGWTPEMIEVPAGHFVMGGVVEDKFVSAVELPRREVKIDNGFLLGRTPLTRREWLEVMGDLPESCHDDLADDCPVVGVSFPEVLEFLLMLGDGYRLPSEAEWEYACRAGSESVFPHGVDLGPEQANYLYDERGQVCGPGHLVPVGSYAPNDFGLHDMLGNICEWMADRWHPGFEGAPCDQDPWVTGGSEGTRVIRGGGWDHLPRVLRVSWRDWAPEDARWDNLGLRLARDLDKSWI